MSPSTTTPHVIKAGELFLESHLMETVYFPLQHPDWLRIIYINWSGTLVGAWIGLLLTTISPIIQQYASHRTVPSGTALTLLVVGILGVGFTLFGWLKDTKRRAIIEKITKYFEERES